MCLQIKNSSTIKMTQMNKHILKIVFSLNFIILAIPLFAFPGDPDGSDDPPFEEPNPVPIDSNIGILIFLAIYLALFLIPNSRKTKISY